MDFFQAQNYRMCRLGIMILVKFSLHIIDRGGPRGADLISKAMWVLQLLVTIESLTCMPWLPSWRLCMVAVAIQKVLPRMKVRKRLEWILFLRHLISLGVKYTLFCRKFTSCCNIVTFFGSRVKWRKKWESDHLLWYSADTGRTADKHYTLLGTRNHD